jgi:hypothetical protein
VAEPLIDAHDAAQTLAATLAVVEAARTGRKIHVSADNRFRTGEAIA